MMASSREEAASIHAPAAVCCRAEGEPLPPPLLLTSRSLESSGITLGASSSKNTAICGGGNSRPAPLLLVRFSLATLAFAVPAAFQMASVSAGRAAWPNQPSFCENRFGADFRPLSSNRGWQAALNRSCHSDRVTRD